jgi:excisionase family DNA binding protein
MEKLLTAEEVSRLLGVCLNTVYRFVGRGELPAIRQGRIIRFRREDIETWLNEHGSRVFPLLDSLKKIDLDLEQYDRLFLKSETRKGGVRVPPEGKVWRYAFGSVFSRPGKNKSERWYIYYRLEGRRVREAVKGAQSRADALKVLQVKIVDAFRGKHGFKREERKISFEEFAKEFLELHSKQNKRSWTRDETSLNSLIPFFKDKALREITPEDVERFKAQRRTHFSRQGSNAKKKKDRKPPRQISPSTVNRELACLKTIFAKAVEWGRLESSPAARVKKFRENSAMERILSFDEQEKLLGASPEHLKPIILAALLTGMRRGEILSLKWSQVDLRKRVILVTGTKSGKDRTIPVNGRLWAELIGLKQRNGNSDHVFHGPDGRPISEIKTSFNSAKRRANIKGFCFHALRHTAASRMIEAGVDLITVKDILGHSSVKITERYTHTRSELKRRAVEVLAQKGARLQKFVPILSPNSEGMSASVFVSAN